MPSKSKHAHHHAPLHRPRDEASNFWAFLTILAFPVGMLVASAFSFSPFQAFVIGAVASFTILIANVMAETRLWMFDKKWRERFEHPEFSFRLAVVTGTILLILETVVLILFFTDGSMDGSLLRMVLSRQCQSPRDGFEQVCSSVLDQTNR